MFLRRLFPLLVAATFAAPVFAQPVVYKCKTLTGEVNTWIPPETYVTHDAQKGEAVAIDGVLQEFLGGPQPVTIVADNAKRTTFMWKVKIRNRAMQYTTMVYRLTVMKADLQATFSANPAGYSNQFNANGKCQKVKA